MLERTLTWHEGLRHAGRWSVYAPAHARISLREWSILLFAGAVAAIASCVLDFNLKIPGHAILRAVFPLALGYACVPRQGAGTVMSAGAAVTTGVAQWGLHLGGSPGALTSLLLLGPFLDFALTGARGGRSVYVRIMLAALAANGMAFVARLAAALLWGAGVHGRNLAGNWQFGLLSYLVCGAAAGLVSAAICFRAKANNSNGESP